MFNTEVNRNFFVKEGFLVLKGYYNITKEIQDAATILMQDTAYKNGRRFMTDNVAEIPEGLRNLVYNDEISNFFNFLEAKIPCQNAMITYDYLNKFEINQYLHFDRWKSLKAMVYLTDVEEGDGAFSVAPGSHIRGGELRRLNKNLPYTMRPNRIEHDFPEDYKKPVKILGPSGTLILFDSDIFHCGGNVSEGHSRKLIRTHWYYNRKWAEIV